MELQCELLEETAISRGSTRSHATVTRHIAQHGLAREAVSLTNIFPPQALFPFARIVHLEACAALKSNILIIQENCTARAWIFGLNFCENIHTQQYNKLF